MGTESGLQTFLFLPACDLRNSFIPFQGHGILSFVEYDAFPAGDLIRQGIEDLRAGRESLQALLVAIGRPRLKRMGISVPPAPFKSPELRLYEVLSRADPDAAHSRYNALVRRLVSFERAVECAG